MDDETRIFIRNADDFASLGVAYMADGNAEVAMHNFMRAIVMYSSIQVVLLEKIERNTRKGD